MMEDKDILKGLEKVLDMLKVSSLANGNMLIEITYKGGLPGLGDRIYIATEIAELLHRRIGHLRFDGRRKENRKRRVQPWEPKP